MTNSQLLRISAGMGTARQTCLITLRHPPVDSLSCPLYHFTCHRDHGILGTLKHVGSIGGTSCPLVQASRVVVSVASVPNPFAHKGVPDELPVRRSKLLHPPVSPA